MPSRSNTSKKDRLRREFFRTLESSFNEDDVEVYRNSSENRPVEDVAREKRKLQNRALAQEIDLRERTLNVLFRFLGAETIVTFAFAFLQATGWSGFKLEEWSFKLLTTVTILQITYMLQVAVKYLFPNHGSNKY